MEKWKKEILENNRKVVLETKRINDEILQIPEYLTEEEKVTYGGNYKRLKRKH